MDSDELVRMANQIALFFAPYPEDDAVEGVRDHLVKFWTPAMRKQLVSIANGLSLDGVALHPLAMRAVHAMQPAGDE
jgi:formate dehydrogenase subunit delta